MLDFILIKNLTGKEFSEEIDHAIIEIKNRIQSQQIIEKNVVNISCFIRAENSTDFLQKRKITENALQSCFIKTLPINIVAQSPIHDKNLNIQIFYLSNIDDDLKIKDKTYRDICYKTIDNSKTKSKTLWVSGISHFDESIETKEAYQKVFQQALHILKLENMSFGDIFRQWNYIGEITKFHPKHSMHNYQLFNNVRAQFYANSSFVTDYPAATGIGMEIPGIVLSFWATSGKTEKSIPVYNELQIEAYDYSEQQLIVNKEKPSHEKCTPKFSRAKYIQSTPIDTLFLSGTASIRGEETLYLNDIEKQTEITLNNIHQLVSAANEQITPSRKKMFRIKYLRTYIKSQEHVATVIAICDKHFQDIPTIFVRADACRPELLVEIEGVAG